MQPHANLLRFLASPNIQSAYTEKPGQASAADIAFPEGLAAAKIYIGSLTPLFQPSAWWACLRDAGFVPTVAIKGRLLSALRVCGVTGARPWSLQATWNALTGNWESQIKIYLRCEHLPVMNTDKLTTLWNALGATPAQAYTAATDGAGKDIEGVAATIGADGLPLVYETYLQGAGTGYDCVSIERTPDNRVTTCHYLPLGARCQPHDLAPWMGVDINTAAAICALLPNPTPNAMAVLKTTPGQPTRKGVCIQCSPHSW